MDKQRFLNLNKTIFVLFLIISVLSCNVLHTNVLAVDDITYSENMKAELEAKNEQLNQNLSDTRENVAVESEKKDSYLNEIVELQGEIAEKNLEIDIVKQDIQKQKELISEREAQIEESKKTLKKRIRAIYISGGDASTIDIILGAENITDFLDKALMIKSITNHDQRIINNLKASVAKLEREKEELSNSQLLLEQKISELNQDKDKLSVLYEESGLKIQQLSEQEKQTLEDIEKNHEQIEALNSEIEKYYEEQRAIYERLKQEEEEKRRIQEEQLKDNSVVQEENPTVYENDSSENINNSTISTDDVKPGNGARGYVWPTPGFYWLSSEYNEDRDSYRHLAIDIAGAGIYETPILAAQSGVVSSSWYSNGGWGGGYGTYCLIDHADGYATLYAHMNEIIVSPGESVERGQVIGYVGSTGESTGPHLHFETRHWGVRYNPMTEY